MIIRLHAFAFTYSNCSLENTKHKCLCEVTSVTCFWFSTTGGGYVLFCLLEKITDSDFAGLNLTSHFVIHRWIFDRSEFNWLAASTGLSTMIYRLVSFAKSLIDELMSSTISLMYKRKSNGPRIEPWGTQEFKDIRSEFAPGRTTLCFLLCK